MKKTLLLMAFAALVPAMSAEITGSGTAADPYKIATADDLTNAWSKMVVGKQIYFVQTADIDMSGVTEHHAISGFNGSYNYALHYDGQNHIIKNFAPAHRDAIASPNAYYCTSLFGVGTGTIKNLGVVNANVPVQQLEGGILGGFSGVGPSYQTIVTKTVLDNVFVQGKINNVAEYTPGAGNYTVTGGMFGMSGQPTEIRNCYVDVDVTGKAEAGGIFGSNGSPLAISNSYAAGQVKGTKSAMIACGSGAVTATDVISFGSTPALVGATSDGITAVAAGDEAAKATIKTWAAFNEGKMMNGYPTLNWVSADQGSTGIDDIIADNDDNAPVEYYNLNGVRVAEPQHGLYIKKQGQQVTKVMVR